MFDPIVNYMKIIVGEGDIGPKRFSVEVFKGVVILLLNVLLFFLHSVNI